MAKKISQLTQATEVKSDDVTVIVQDGETKKLPLNMMVTKQDIENKKIAGLAKLDEIEATYENDTYTPTITVKNKSSVKTGEGDGVDYSANVMDGPAKSAILSGNTCYRDIDTGEILESFEEGRNLELVSVKMPVLTTSNGFEIFKTGTTLDEFDYNLVELNNGCISISHSHSAYIETKKEYTLLPNQSYVVRVVEVSNFNNSNYHIRLNIGGRTVKSVTESLLVEKLSKNSYYDIVYTNTTGKPITGVIRVDSYFGRYKIDKIYIGEEPFKSNILMVNEDVTLRGIDEVQDTLDCLTGEVTERIGEIVLDGNANENWTLNTKYDMNDTYAKFILKNVPNDMLLKNSLSHWITNRFKNHLRADGVPNEEGISSEGNMNAPLMITIKRDKLTESTPEGFKKWLVQNPVTVQYNLVEPVIKTVDLMPSGTHPSTTPYCWKNGHIQLSSSGLLPNLEYSVVTSRAGQINQNATMIVKNDKRIFDLEILLAGGLVNTTYQALTLQNQVETGLSKVSLSSETEPDYLLYHMIMKLIEEKAYKLDDLTEKVSVFYLYEKLSDEQFETIYSALYPFVEDEIVEEPVVEELPEVVEDEVIM